MISVKECLHRAWELGLSYSRVLYLRQLLVSQGPDVLVFLSGGPLQ